ncbi:MAG: hypothetical protein Q7S73_01455 [bacterium]|nr:hypothetical protein [bacterium]
MDDTKEFKNLGAAFESLPPNVKERLSSLQTTYLVTEINQRLGIKNERGIIIPKLIFRLVTQDIEPTEFINALSHELMVSFTTAKSIAEDIENKILKPIENELRRDVGVDVKLIYFGKPGSASAAQKPATEPATQSAAIPLETARPIGPSGAQARAESLTGPASSLGQASVQKSFKDFLEPSLAPKKEEAKIDLQSLEAPSSPFILHQETEVSSPKPTFNARPDLSIKIQNYSRPASEEKKSASKAVSVRLETPENNPAARVVHYSGPRTPITNIGTPKNPADQNRIDLRKFEKSGDNIIDLKNK